MKLDISKITNSTDVIVRFSDTDAMGIVHFNKYFIYFEDGFISFLTSLGWSPGENLKKGIVFPIVESHCKYKASAKFGDVLEVVTKIEKFSTHSLTCTHEVLRKSNKEVLAFGTLVRVCYSLDQKKVPIKDVFPIED
jgi:acyl-CoA thioester hydrolase